MENFRDLYRINGVNPFFLFCRTDILVFVLTIFAVCSKNATFHCYDRLALLLAHSAFPAFTLRFDLCKARLHLYKPILQD